MSREIPDLWRVTHTADFVGIAGVRYIYYASRSRAHPFFRYPSLAHRSADRCPARASLQQPGAQPDCPAQACARGPACLIAHASY